MLTLLKQIFSTLYHHEITNSLNFWWKLNYHNEIKLLIDMSSVIVLTSPHNFSCHWQLTPLNHKLCDMFTILTLMSIFVMQSIKYFWNAIDNNTISIRNNECCSNGQLSTHRSALQNGKALSHHMYGLDAF